MIEDFNPWWMSREGVKEMEIYRRYAESEVKWRSDLIDRLSLRPFSLNFVFGPRQVGKSTALILLVKELLERGVQPKSVFYLSCDTIADYRELAEVLRMYLKVRRAEGISSSYILLDEVTYPREWFRAVKSMIDMGYFRNDVLVLSGSLSISARREAETFTGRRGHGRNLVMLPLPFGRFAELFGLRLPRGGLEFVLGSYMRFLQYVSRLVDVFETYLAVGGFPNAVREYFKYGRVSSAYGDFISAVLSDLNKLRRSETFFKLTARAIVEKTPSRVSYHTISKSFGVGTVKTAVSYVELLEKMFLLKTVYAMDVSGEVQPRREKKFYFVDPFIYHAFARWTMTKPPGEHALAEVAVVTHLARLYDVFYLRHNGEVDAVVRSGDSYIGVEVKYGWAEGVKRVLGVVKRIYTLSRDSAEEGVIPAALFLGLLDVPQTVEVPILV
jgi:Predicted ATPase (AAA+ superfamily)